MARAEYFRSISLHIHLYVPRSGTGSGHRQHTSDANTKVYYSSSTRTYIDEGLTVIVENEIQPKRINNNNTIH